MDNYEIKILRRGGNWKNVSPDDLIMDQNIDEEKLSEQLNTKNSNESFLFSINKVNAIVKRLEVLESEKNKLKEELKIFENECLNKKNFLDNKIFKISQEKELIEKTINIIKNLKSF